MTKQNDFLQHSIMTLEGPNYQPKTFFSNAKNDLASLILAQLSQWENMYKGNVQMEMRLQDINNNMRTIFNVSSSDILYFRYQKVHYLLKSTFILFSVKKSYHCSLTPLTIPWNSRPMGSNRSNLDYANAITVISNQCIMPTNWWSNLTSTFGLPVCYTPCQTRPLIS